jgi:hypothetical protein
MADIVDKIGIKEVHQTLQDLIRKIHAEEEPEFTSLNTHSSLSPSPFLLCCQDL